MHQKLEDSVLKAPICNQWNDPTEPLGEVGVEPDVVSVPLAAGGNISPSVPLEGPFAAFLLLGICKGFW